jgi:ATP-binding cassette, subfamily C (CFTR/MRP), member 1
LESLDGLATIRAFCWQSQFKALNYKRLDISQRPLYLRIVMQRWLGSVLEMLTLAIVLLVVGLIVGLRGKISAGYAGVALSNMIIFSFLVGNMVIVWTQMENSMVSVERIKEFSEVTPSEQTESENIEPPENWPSQGNIQIRHLNATYR